MIKKYCAVNLSLKLALLILIFEAVMVKNLSARQQPIGRALPDTTKTAAQKLPSPKGAMIRSVIFPGWGQWYNGKKLKAGFVFFTETGIVSAAVYWNQKAKVTSDPNYKAFYLDNRNQSFWYLGGAILLSMADAFVDAHLAGFDVSPDLGFGKGNRKIGLALRYRF